MNYETNQHYQAQKNDRSPDKYPHIKLGSTQINVRVPVDFESQIKAKGNGWIRDALIAALFNDDLDVGVSKKEYEKEIRRLKKEVEKKRKTINVLMDERTKWMERNNRQAQQIDDLQDELEIAHLSRISVGERDEI